MSLCREPIGDYVERITTWSPAKSNIASFQYIDLSSVSQDEKSIVGANVMPTSEAPSRARQIVQAGDVLVSTVRPNLNGVAHVPPQFDGCTASTGFCVLRPREGRLSGRYLYHWVRSSLFVKDMVGKSTGASYPAVSDKIVKASSIPLPPLDEQRRISAILDKADSLRQKRKQAIALLDSLTQSIFLEMFGDPVSNPKGWPQNNSLSDIADIASGITKGRKLRGEPTRTVPYLAVANVQDKTLKLDIVKTIEATEAEIGRYRLQVDDLLLTEGGDPDKLGRGSLWRGELHEAIHQNHIFRVRLTSNNVHPLYAMWLIGSDYGKRYFLKSAKQTTGIASINKTQLSNLPFLLPPKKLQQEFADQAQAVKTKLDKLLTCEDLTNSLFSSLQHRAFSGEL
ncbi:restriction endonuclease subunit S [Roseibium alexandrii]|uniref:Restriction endonuclease S subunit n=1 Tax=Roseibium alexandrii (strain DSM 17067 / NCIMB 14079 / DFL-11) TaxID=244592 RepID=A0A5E8H6W4_ROSAD|nr:restriction endonuclease subunit S [Roseibium alexandrii]EEE47951.2 Restriction endonuclease S subunit [Roseibium alexandrii DFL-11]